MCWSQGSRPEMGVDVQEPYWGKRLWRVKVGKQEYSGRDVRLRCRAGTYERIGKRMSWEEFQTADKSKSLSHADGASSRQSWPVEESHITQGWACTSSPTGLCDWKGREGKQGKRRRRERERLCFVHHGIPNDYHTGGIQLNLSKCLLNEWWTKFDGSTEEGTIIHVWEGNGSKYLPTCLKY